MAQQRSGRPHKLTEQDRRVLKSVRIICHLTTEFQTISGSNVSTITVRRELCELGFHGRAAAHKPKITMRNVNLQLEWCKASRH